MYIFDNNLRSAFKKRPSGIIPGQGIESAPGSGKPKNPSINFDIPKPKIQPTVQPIDYGIPENQGEIEGHPFKFNIATGYPKSVEIGSNRLAEGLAGKPLIFAKHAKDRALEKGLDFDNELGHLQGGFPKPEHGFKPVEVEVIKQPQGSRITKMVMRGPREGKSDAIMPVITENPRQPFVSTVWPNDIDDNHSSLDLRRVHLPDEFAHGKSPTRKLVSDQERKKPGYRPLYDSPEVRAEILKRHGIRPA